MSPRRNEENQYRRDDDDDEESDCSTDSDCEYHLTTEEAAALTRNSQVSTRAISDVFCKQRGMCRITGMPFATGIYAPVLVARKCNESISDTNCMLVIEMIHRLRVASDMNWRTFVQFLNLVGKEAQL